MEPSKPSNHSPTDPIRPLDEFYKILIERGLSAQAVTAKNYATKSMLHSYRPLF